MFKKLFGKKEEEIKDEIKEDIADEVVEALDEAEATLSNVVEEVKEEVEELVEEAKEVVEDIVEAVEEIKEEAPKMGFFQKLKAGLDKTSKAITDKIDDLLNNYGEIDDDLFEELEEILIMADVGMDTTMHIIEELQEELKRRKINDASLVKEVLKDVLEEMMHHERVPLNIEPSPAIILVIGVNGAGKTTSIGKIANNLRNEGKSVLLAAGDTFRAAAIDQLKVWADRVGVNVIAHSEGSDPAAVIFDAIQSAKAKNVDVLICDTAGRLHNKKNLMNELNKVFRVVEREYPGASREVLLVLDATTGQNAVAQAKTFSEVADISGLVLTKLDGTAKGGVVLAINHQLGIPVKLIGVGEGKDDLQQFSADDFVEALLNLK